MTGRQPAVARPFRRAGEDRCDRCHGGPVAAYEALVARGLRRDTAQGLAAERLQGLHDALGRPRPAWPLSRRAARRPAARGVYLFGPVGRGKSMLMDLFFAHAPVPAKRRVHFHTFMLEVHAGLHRTRRDRAGDPLPGVAATIGRSCHLLCLDEFQVTDIADAMILGRLFTRLLDGGLVVVATSNAAPAELYRNGLQRARFLPFIDLVRDRFTVVDLGSGADFRRAFLPGRPVYHCPSGVAATRQADAALAILAAGHPLVPTDLTVAGGRRLRIGMAGNRVARASFDTLCRAPLAAADYLALVTRVSHLVLDDIPVLGPEERDAAQRFIILIDMLYEHGCKLVCTAAAAPDALLRGGVLADSFRRTASRLVEMQSAAWLDRPVASP